MIQPLQPAGVPGGRGGQYPPGSSPEAQVDSQAGQIVLADVMAPLSVPVIYTVTAGTGTWSAPAVTRTYTGHLLVSLDGLIGADFDWLDNDDPIEQRPRFAAFDIPGSEFPIVRYDGAVAGGGTVWARTVLAGTRALESLVRNGRPVALLHNSAECVIPDCDTPLMQTVLITAAPRKRTGTVDRVRRDWDLSYLLVADPEPGTPVPVTTWDDFDAAHAGTTWNAFDTAWAARSWDELDRTVWEQAP